MGHGSPYHVHTLRGHLRVVTALAPNPEPNMFFSSSMDASIRVWNLENFECVHKFDFDAPVLTMAVRPDIPHPDSLVPKATAAASLATSSSSASSKEIPLSPLSASTGALSIPPHSRLDSTTSAMAAAQQPSNAASAGMPPTARLDASASAVSANRIGTDAPSSPTRLPPTHHGSGSEFDWARALTATVCVALGSRCVKVYRSPCPSARTAFAHVRTRAQRLLRFPADEAYLRWLQSHTATRGGGGISHNGTAGACGTSQSTGAGTSTATDIATSTGTSTATGSSTGSGTGIGTSSAIAPVVLCLADDSSVREIGTNGATAWAAVPADRSLIGAVTDVAFAASLRRLFVCNAAHTTFVYEVRPNTADGGEKGRVAGAHSHEAVCIGQWAASSAVRQRCDHGGFGSRQRMAPLPANIVFIIRFHLRTTKFVGLSISDPFFMLVLHVTITVSTN
jgi:hypothetical protein